MRKPLVLLGTGGSAKYAPPDDGRFEFWGPAYLVAEGRRLDLGFEIHDEQECKAVGVWDGMRSLSIPVLMIARHADLPTSVAYPLEAVTARFTPAGRVKPYLTSVLDYMLAYLLLQAERPPAVHLHGFDMQTDTEYAGQVPGGEFWLGALLGAGIPFTLPRASDLLKVKYLYGIEQRAQEAELNDLLEELAQYRAHQEHAEGALQLAAGRREQIRGHVAQLQRAIKRARR